ncbi:DUF3817 domain-containing protein [Ghiorsea bivora]|uniref:DUF3817 domain-containing protein n=1 Tax=Ghiorsea bivora TaxID=1485545 RepID=UPI0005717759|nr:DUF3817 domain-containing protein [Ghiorsea bivora]
MLKTFRILSMIEGLSLIALLFIAMPAKYQYGIDLVKFVGPIHGMLWLAYLPMLDATNRQQKWPSSMLSIAFITSVIPFGCFYLEKKIRAQGLVPNKSA